ncbi:MAG: serine/threonine protein kinase [Verrucomicrobia bacterium]|nr:serine/threonine protein kinase [Verrucomicrobiota bacterium]
MKSPVAKWFWLVPLLVAVLVGLVGWWADQKVSKAIQKSLKAELQSSLNANVAALEIWIRNQERMAEEIADEPQVRKASFDLLSQTAAVRAEPRAFAMSERHQEFERSIKARLKATSYLAAQLVTTNRLIVGTSWRGLMRLGVAVNEAHEAKFDELFRSGKAIIITPFKPVIPPPPQNEKGFRKKLFGDDTNNTKLGRFRPAPRVLTNKDISLMQVAAPLKDADDVIRGALAFVLRPEDEFTRVLSIARSGQSGETFAFDQNGLMISQSRFDTQLIKLGLLNSETNTGSALTLELHDPGADLTQGGKVPADLDARPLTPMIADAVKGGAGVAVEPQRDYRGVLVVGAWRWLPQYGFGVATKLDATEAYQPLKVLRLTYVILVLLLALCAVGVLLFSYSSLVWRQKFDAAQLQAKQLGQYVLEEKIGAGGMGTVYKARHALLRRETAIKLLLPEVADEFTIRQFEREVQLTCQLTHPNTIQVYDYGSTPEGIFYYAMEYLRGLTLTDLVLQHGAQTEARVIHILRQVCESLQEAHAVGLIHRDVKPGNIFLCERGGVPDTVKVLDFGLVRHLREDDAVALRSVETDLVVGSPLYMSPEAIQNPAQTDARSDLYAVGAVGYFLLTGGPVFDGADVAAILDQHVSATPVPTSQRTGNPVSAEFEQLLLRCLAKQPEQRPQSATELLALLRACAAAGGWTLETRAAWWNSHAILPHVDDAKTPSSFERTVKIDMGDRAG